MPANGRWDLIRRVKFNFLQRHPCCWNFIHSHYYHFCQIFLNSSLNTCVAPRCGHSQLKLSSRMDIWVEHWLTKRAAFKGSSFWFNKVQDLHEKRPVCNRVFWGVQHTFDLSPTPLIQLVTWVFMLAWRYIFKLRERERERERGRERERERERLLSVTKSRPWAEHELIVSWPF